MKFIVLIGLALTLAAFIRFALFSGLQVRRMRWRTRLRMKPGPGFASHAEIWVRWSRWAAVYSGRRARPDMGFWVRMFSPATRYAVRLGRAQLWRRIWARGEDQVGVIAPQRTGKTGVLADRVYSHPGAAVSITTRADVHNLTAGKRAQLGPVEVFNPEGIGGVESTFRPDIISDCVAPHIALRTAAALIGPTGDQGDMEFWLGKARVALAALLHAAAILGEDVDAVWRWANRVGDSQVREAATRRGASVDLLAAAIEIQREGKSADSIRMTLCRSLGWVAVPSLRNMVSGPGLRYFDAGAWALNRGTVYFITSGEESEAAPLFRAVIEKLYRDVVYAGSLTRYGKLALPVLFALDELTQTCAVPVDQWLATAAGSGIQIMYVVHSPSQLQARYGQAVANAIWALSSVKVILPGNSDAEMAEQISALCGSYGNETSERIVPVAYIRQLPELRALVVAMNRAPITVKVRPIWRRVSYRLGMMPKPPRALPWLPEVLEVEYEPGAAPEPGEQAA